MRGATEYLKSRSRIIAVEVGVRSGEHAREFLEHLDIERLYLVDHYDPYIETPIGSPPMEWNRATQEVWQREAFRLLGRDPRASFLKQSSEVACSWLDDGQFDIVYIDCLHTYPAVLDDLHRWHCKLKPGGMLAGHDYGEQFPGVSKAVNEFAEEKKLVLLTFEDSDWVLVPSKKQDHQRAIVTIAIGGHRRLHELSEPSKRKYADKIGADLIVIDKPFLSETTCHWEKFQIYDLLEKYERLIYMDADTLIRDDCPNLFEIVPQDSIGMFNEAPFTLRARDLMVDICLQYGVTLPEWNGKYYNAGLMVISRCHKDLYKKPEKEYSSFYEQSYLNLVFCLEKTKMFDLEHRFNRMPCMDNFLGEDRRASYIIHYAGCPVLQEAIAAMRRDIGRWAKDAPNYSYKKHIHVSVNGGAGDQFCAEPAIRHLKSLYPSDEIVIASHWPRLFEHLAGDGVMVCDHSNVVPDPDTAYYRAKSLPGPDTIHWSIVSQILCHTVDYCSIALLKRTLPVEDKTFQFMVTADDRRKALSLVPKKTLEEMVIVHPGKHWNSKTFPSKFWQSIVDGLVSSGIQVGIIGKEEPGDPPDFKAGARGTVQINVPDRVFDFREKLELGPLGAILSMAKILISNDSFPVHLAGAFDNWIFLIPSCKHPDHVLPWRHGSVQYKTKSFYKRLVIDDIESRPTQVYPTSAEVQDIEWDRYLPDTKEIIDLVKSVMEK